MGTMKHGMKLGTAILAAAFLTACAYADPNTDYTTPSGKGNKGSHAGGYNDIGSVFGPGGLGIGNDSPPVPGEGTGGSGIGVNSFLWRASLDTMSFMPLASADPFGGVIITDWYTPPEVREERFKVTVYILGRELRADGLRASVFRQRQGAEGTWVDAGVEPQTSADLENAILVRARQLRIAGLQ
jgi:uncharacterized protein DUF3576